MGLFNWYLFFLSRAIATALKPFIARVVRHIPFSFPIQVSSSFPHSISS